MRFPILLTIAIALTAGASTALAQGAGGGGASSSGGGARGGGGPTGPATTAPSTGVPTSPSVNSPAVPAPGVANTPIDPGRNNVDANPPTRRMEGATPSTTGPVTSAPAPQPGQPGATTAAPSGKAASRPGAAQTANSDGFAECMAMWSPGNTRMSREEWSATCERTRLPPKPQ